MINNFIPWNQADYCLTDSWYIANDFWFMIIAMNMVETFLKSKKMFLVYSVLWTLLCFIIQIIQITHYKLTPSYLSLNNTYWDMYLRKPFPHFHSFCIGMILGCGYHAYKSDQLPKGGSIYRWIQLIKESRVHGIAVFTAGFTIQLIICVLSKFNNNRAELGAAWSTIYLLFSRPLFAVGFSMMVLPLVLGNAQLAQLTQLLSHRYWVPFEKLTYGVFLINSVIMQFRTFNLSNGVWVESFHLQLLFLSILTLSFLLSALTYLFVEAPMSNLLSNFIAARRNKANSQFYLSQSAKAHLRDKRTKKRQP